MKNALILHGTDFEKNQKQRQNNWFPWLKKEMEKIGYHVWLPELSEVWHPDLERYWKFVKNFEFNKESIIIGHSSGGAFIFGLLNKLPVGEKIKLAISVSGFYKDKGWNCEGLFSENLNWKKIKNQAEKIYIIWSPDDPYISQEQTDFLCRTLNIQPTILPNNKHFNLGSSPEFKQFPELLENIEKNS